MSETSEAAAPLSLRDRLAREAHMFAKFGVVGAAAFVIDAGLLKLGIFLGLAKALARLISILIAMHFTFAVNRVWAFKHLRAQSLLRQWAGYMAANGAGALLNYGTFLALTRAGAPFEHMPIVAAAAGTGVGMFVNFAGARLLAFRR